MVRLARKYIAYGGEGHPIVVGLSALTLHDEPYPAISPHRPELSQVGRTVLICGGSTGIGHAIARNFCEAGASNIIILGRRANVLDDAVAKLATGYPKTTVEGRVCDVFDLKATAALWDELESASNPTPIDVLVWNAVHYPELKPILEQGSERLWKDFEGNVHAPLFFVERFYKQPNHDSQKYCVYVATRDIHQWDSAPMMPGYQLTKNAFACTLQQIAAGIPADKMQTISFHPSVIFTEAGAGMGFTKETFPWPTSDENLPGQFGVWAASQEASFLHGRFVWCNWDVDELSSGDIRKRIDSDPWYLKVGVKGL
ncbi:hypothetical protein BX600DRAFT_554132 [Xylariales sp. PMI_506]|nr:hypothetical protein BX600DRAFT_554132 [Xylariales sp. PMI_506]